MLGCPIWAEISNPLWTLYCNWSRHIQESQGPLDPKSSKSLKKVFPGLLARSVKKVSKKSKMTRKRVKKTTKSVFGDFFDTFLTLRAGRPGKSFLRLFGDFGPRGCGDSCIRGLQSQYKVAQSRIREDEKFAQVEESESSQRSGT